MALASGTRADIIYIAETTRGVTPGTPAMKKLRLTQRNINGTKELLESQEVREDRQVADQRHGFNQVAGTFGYELGLQSFDDMVEAAMSGTWTAFNIAGAPNLQASASAGPTNAFFTRAAGNFVTDGLRPGDIVITTGFTAPANNGRFRVSAVTSTTLSILEELVDEASASSRTLQLIGKRVDVGSVLRTFTIERRFNDINQFEVSRGVCVNEMATRISPREMLGGTLTMLGMAFDPMAGSSIANSVVAAPTNPPLAAFDGVVYLNGAVVAVVTSIDFTIQNNRSLEAVVGSRFSPDVFEGTARITGNVSFMFVDAVIHNLFVNETDASIWLKLNEKDTTGFHSIVLPRVKYNGSEKDPGQQGPVIQNMPFAALVHGTTGTSMSWQRSNT